MREMLRLHRRPSGPSQTPPTHTHTRAQVAGCLQQQPVGTRAVSKQTEECGPSHPDGGGNCEWKPVKWIRWTSGTPARFPIVKGSRLLHRWDDSLWLLSGCLSICLKTKQNKNLTSGDLAAFLACDSFHPPTFIQLWLYTIKFRPSSSLCWCWFQPQQDGILPLLLAKCFCVRSLCLTVNTLGTLLTYSV